jgi:hypothetical protein
MKTKAILDRAGSLVGGNRKVAYGDVTAGMDRIAAVWNGILTAAGAAPARALDAHDVANMMEGLKIARRYTGPYRADNYVDGAGWAAVAGEAGEKRR